MADAPGGGEPWVCFAVEFNVEVVVAVEPFHPFIAAFGAPNAESACNVKFLEIEGNAAVKSYRTLRGV